MIDKALEGTLKYAFGDNEKAVRQYFEALVDQAAGKQTGKVTKTGATVTEQEKFNAQQDAKMRRLANAFGFGEDLGANVQTMRVAQEGQQALNDLAADFAGRGGLLAKQADAIQRAYHSGVREVEAQTNGLIEAKFAQIQNTVSDLIKQGVTDEADWVS